MNDCVVVIRTNKGDDLLALFELDKGDKVRVRYPYYIRYNPTTQNITMVAYCALSDETYYELKHSDIEFIVVANDDISNKFIGMIGSYEKLVTNTEPESEDTKSIITGNLTIH